MKHPPHILRFFLVVALPLLVGAHYYFIERLVLEPEFPRIGGWILGLLGLLIICVPFARRRIPTMIARPVTIASAIWLGAGFLLLLVLAASDLLLFALDLLVPDALASTSPLVDSRVQAVAVIGITGLATASGALSVFRPPPILRREVHLERWPTALNGYRIVQLSDIHIGPFLGLEFCKGVVRRANETAPDLLVVTGDIVDGSVARLASHVAPLAGLEARDGVYFVTGNHEYFSQADPWVTHFESLGLTPLRNRHVPIGNDEAGFDLVGVDDHLARMFGYAEGGNLERALEGRDPRRPCILLAHNPAAFDEAAERGVDLQLSGHTHGGQIWPFGYVVKLLSPYLAGLYQKGRSRLYVSRGTGFWGPPLRLGAPAEITEITLRGGRQP